MYKIMIVDDMDIVKRELKRLKIWGEASGFVISSEASNGQQALDLLAKNPVDLIITDIKMPKIDGIELLRDIVAGKLCSCVVLLSDYSEFKFARQGIILGAFDYIPKPVDEKELISLLIRAKEYLDHENQEKEKLKRLELLNSEENDEYISLPDVAELLKFKDQNTLGFSEQMIVRIWDKGKADLSKCESILGRTLQELVKEISRSNTWLDKFINITEFQTCRFQPGKDFKDVRSLFLDRIKDLIYLFNVLKYDILGKGIVGKVCRYVLEHVEHEISLAMVADTLYINKTYLSETFKLKTGIPFTEYVTGVKMERAKLLMMQESLKSYEVADMLGFKDTEYFSKVFKKSTGLTPTEFRKKIINKELK